MTVPLEKFVQQLEDSGVLDRDTLKEFLPPKASPASSEELALELVRRKKLTKFQAGEISRGMGKSLVLGNYILMEKIGAGGMGQVFKARHRVMERFVAVKVLPRAMTYDQNALSRFHREVKAAAKLNHPNIVTAYDADHAGGVHFLVMEFVEGTNLSALVKRNGPLPVNQAVNFILQAAKGLEFAHEKGVVHRDIKPSNLLLSNDGSVKILDMGLAHIHEDTAQVPLTSTGDVMGTADYMAPEQAMNTKSADARADVYALGCSLHYLVTGKATYDGASVMARLLAHRDNPIPRLGVARPDVPEQVESVFHKMVAKSADDRYQSMTELIVDLERCISARSASRKSHEVSQTSFEFTSKIPSSRRDSAAKTILNLRSVKQILNTNDDRRKLIVIGAGIFAVAMLASIPAWLSFRNVNQNQTGATIPSKDESVAAVKKPLAFETPEFQQWLKATTAMPVEKQVEEVSKKLRELNPQFDGKLSNPHTGSSPPVIQNGAVVQLGIVIDNVTDVSPIRVFSELARLECLSSTRTGRLLDLSPLSGMKIGAIRSYLVGIDLSTVKGLPLRDLACSGAGLTNLTQLSNLPIENLTVSGNWDLRNLEPLRGMSLAYLACDNCQIEDLSPLSGMALKQLICHVTNVKDLSPLKGMPLEVLTIEQTAVTNLSPLAGMRLKELRFSPNPGLKGIEAIRQMDSLERIGTSYETLMTPGEFWKQYDEKGTREFDRWVKETADLPAEKQIEEVSKKLKELNPNFDGKLASPHNDGNPPVIQNGAVVELMIISDKVTDVSPLRAFSELRFFQCRSLRKVGQPMIKPPLDLSPLNGMKIQAFRAELTYLDLSTVEGLPITDLACFGNGITDLEPVSKMPVKALTLSGNWELSILEPLRGMSLTFLACDNCQVDDLSALSGMPLRQLLCHSTNVRDLSPLKGMPLEQLFCDHTFVNNLSPLADMKLKRLTFPSNPGLKGIEAIRQMDSLEQIGTTFEKLMPRNEFWKQFDEGTDKDK